MFTKFHDVAMIIAAFSTYYLIDSKVLTVRSSSGNSMDPTITSNSILVVDKLFYKLGAQKIKKGDIVVALQPTDPNTHICKRVVQTGGLYLPDHPTIMVPPGEYWLEGDNRSSSYDSRHHGTVPEHLIEGKVVFWISL